MSKKLLFLFAFSFTLIGYLSTAQLGRAQQEFVYSIEVEGTIDAGISNFIRKSIDRAELDNVPLIIKMNTPGGLLSATKDIVQRMLNAETHIVVWITPKGAWGFSAGTFILLASNTAAMDEATSIGAAGPRPPDPKTTKAMADWIESIAEQRDRPGEIARSFVTENLAMGPREALDNEIIELRASDISEILEHIGMPDAKVKPIEMGIFEKALRVFSNPDVVAILFTIGLLGIIAEITTPGIGVPGVGGAICLLLALWGLGVLEVNIVGIALVLLGAALIAAEIFTAGFGAFGVGGVVSLILGLMMVDKEPWIEVVGDMAKGVAIGIFVVFSISMVLARRAMKKPVSVGKETIIGQIGFAATDIKPDGMVKVKGELWRATSTEHIEKGEEIVVKDLKGLVLVIEKRKK